MFKITFCEFITNLNKIGSAVYIPALSFHNKVQLDRYFLNNFTLGSGDLKTDISIENATLVLIRSQNFHYT